MTLPVQGSIRMLWDQPISTFYAPTYHDIIQVSYCGWGYGSMMSIVGLVEGTFSPWLFRSPLCGHDACRPNSVCFIVVLNSLYLVLLLIDTPTGDAPPSHIELQPCAEVLCSGQSDRLTCGFSRKPAWGDTKRAEPSKQHKQNWNSVQTTSKVLPTNGLCQWCQPIPLSLVAPPKLPCWYAQVAFGFETQCIYLWRLTFSSIHLSSFDFYRSGHTPFSFRGIYFFP